MRRVLAALAGAIIATLGPIGGATAQPDDEVVGIELVAHPDQADMGRRGIVSIVAEASPGQHLDREVIVSNDTTQDQRVLVYVGRAHIDEGGFVPDDGDGGVPAWATVDEGVLSLAAGERRRVRVSFDVPRVAEDGEYFGVVWAQPPASSGPVQKVNRVGIRVYLSVTGGRDSTTPVELAELTDFVIESMTPRRLDDGRPQLQALVRNTGHRALDLIGELDLSQGPGGTRAGPFVTDTVTTVAVGREATVAVTMPVGVPSGPWRARLVLASGSVERAAEADVTFPDEPAASDPVPAEMTAVERQRRLLIPIATTMLVTAVTVLVVLVVGSRRATARFASGDHGRVPVDVEE